MDQNPREVATKIGRSIDTFLARGFEEAEAVLSKWIDYLDETALSSPDDPLFPATALTANTDAGFKTEGFERRHWKCTEPVRKIVNHAFAAANLQAFGPHAFRHMHARHAAKTCTSIAELISTSQNLGHKDVMTTVGSHSQISHERQRALVTGES